MTKKENALRYLYSHLKATKISLDRALVRPNVTPEEIENLQLKIAALDWLIPVAIRTDDEGGEEQCL